MKSSINLNNTEKAFAYKSDAELKNTIFIFGLLQKPFSNLPKNLMANS
jgi:hypothetical protein